MTTTTNVDKVKINLLSQDQYDSMIINPNELYFITDSDTRYVKASEVSDVGYTGNYEDIINTPNFANVATSGSYTDLSNKPTISTVGSTGEYSDLLNKPTVDQTYNDESTNAQSGVAVASALSTLDSTIVHLSGDEEIEGVKSFNNTAEFAAGKGIKIKSSDANEYWNIRSSGGQSTGCALMKNNDADYNAFKAENDHINIGSANILPYSVTPDTSDNSTRIATTAFVKAQGYAVDSDVVHKTGNETISGKKIFTDGCYANGSWSVERTDFVKGDIPASTKYFGIMELDVEPNDSTSTAWQDRRLGIIETCVNTSGETQTYLATYKNATNANGGGNNFRITLHYPASGSGYADITSSPATSDNSTKIATTAFVKAQGYTTNTGTITEIKMNGTSMGTSGVVDLGTVITSHQSLSNYVTLNGSQTISGAKTLSANLTISKSTPNLIWKNTAITKGTAPTAASNTDAILIRDSANKNMSYIRSRYNTDSSTETWIYTVRSSTASDTNARAVGLTYPSSGSDIVFKPSNDNSIYLGYTSYRWKQVYAGTTSISTSDERLKQQISDIPDEVLDAWSKVNFCQFKFNDAVEEKGENARLHTGMIAQRIKEVFEEADIDPFTYGLLCYDEWDAEEADTDPDGNIIKEARPAGNRYSLRYEECLCMECAYQRRKNQQLEERIARLEKLIN